jgi:hypothetical protein
VCTTKTLLLLAMAPMHAAMLGGCVRSTVSPSASSPAGIPPAAAAPSIPSSVAAPAAPVVSAPAYSPPLIESSLSNDWKPQSKPRDWKHIVLHHTATESGSVESIHEAHIQNTDKSGKPWLGIGYHFVIGNGQGMDDGTIEPTFRWREQMHGAHAGASDPEYNQLGVGICLVGNFETSSPSPAQLAATRRLVAYLKREYRIDDDRVIGHKDIRETECPGKLFPLADVAIDPQIPSLAGLNGTNPDGLAPIPVTTLRPTSTTAPAAVVAERPGSLRQ